MQTNSDSTNLWKMGGVMALACLVPLLALAAIFVFRIPINTVALFAIVLICPVLHLFMMRNHDHGGHQSPSSQQSVSHNHDHNLQE